MRTTFPPSAKGPRRARSWLHRIGIGGLVTVVGLALWSAPIQARQDGSADDPEPASADPASGDSAPVEAAALDLLGHGWGHGRGMGQYGALGYALDGWGTDRILAHFYGDTTKARVAPSTMTVRLLSRDGLATTVTVGGGNRLVTRVGNGTHSLAPGRAVRITHVGGGSYRIADGPDCDGPFTDRPGTVSGSYVAVRAAVAGGDSGSESQFSYGAAGAYVVAGDWDGDGVDTIGWRRKNNNVWHLRNSNSGGPDDLRFGYGNASVQLGDIPIAGDWDGDGIDTIGVYRTSNRTWYLRNSNSGGSADLTLAYGSPGDLPVPGDWDGDGDDTVGVLRGDTWLLRQANRPGPAQITASFRRASDIHVPGDTDGDGSDDRNSYNPTTGVFHLRDEDFDGRADQRIRLGQPGSSPIIGDWDGDGIDEVGVFSDGQFTLDGIDAAGSGFELIDGNDPDLPLSDTLQLCTGGGDVQWLRGEIRAARFESSQRTVNALDTEQYLRSVVPRESPASWATLGDGAGMAALEAQAVAARSYSLAENRYGYAKTCDTISCQVYAGRQKRVGGSIVNQEDPRTDAAIAGTRGEIRRRGGATQRTEFSSSTGGYTAGGVFPAVIDEGDDVPLNPNHDWSTVIPASTIESYYGIPGFTGMTVVERNGLGEDGGRAVTVRLHFANTTIERTGSQIQAAFGLKSDWFTPAGDTLPPPRPGNGPTLMLSNRLRTAKADVTFRFGRRSETIFAGDFDGDGDDSFVYRRGKVVTGSNELRASPLELSFSYGRASDEVYLGDWDGDGVATFTVRRGNTFYVSNRNRGGTADQVFSYGKPGDELVVGDWDGDGRDSFAVRRGNVFYVSNSLRGGKADFVFAYGRAGDALVIGDWDGDGRDTMIVRRGNIFYVSNRLRTSIAERVFAYGRPGDEVYAGDWDGDGLDTLGVRR